MYPPPTKNSGCAFDTIANVTSWISILRFAELVSLKQL